MSVKSIAPQQEQIKKRRASKTKCFANVFTFPILKDQTEILKTV